jgi:hypothetical protein
MHDSTLAIPLPWILFHPFVRDGSNFTRFVASLIVFQWYMYSFRHNSTLQTLGILHNFISAPVLKIVELEFVLCQLRNAHVTQIDARRKGFDDADAIRIAEALRCEILHMCLYGRTSSSRCPETIAQSRCVHMTCD